MNAHYPSFMPQKSNREQQRHLSRPSGNPKQDSSYFNGALVLAVTSGSGAVFATVFSSSSPSRFHVFICQTKRHCIKTRRHFAGYSELLSPTPKRLKLSPLPHRRHFAGYSELLSPTPKRLKVSLLPHRKTQRNSTRRRRHFMLMAVARSARRARAYKNDVSGVN